VCDSGNDGALDDRLLSTSLGWALVNGGTSLGPGSPIEEGIVLGVSVLEGSKLKLSSLFEPFSPDGDKDIDGTTTLDGIELGIDDSEPPSPDGDEDIDGTATLDGIELGIDDSEPFSPDGDTDIDGGVLGKDDGTWS